MRTEMKMSKAKLRRFRAVVARVDEIIDVAWLRDILGPEYDEKSPGIRLPGPSLVYVVRLADILRGRDC